MSLLPKWWRQLGRGSQLGVRETPRRLEPLRLGYPPLWRRLLCRLGLHGGFIFSGYYWCRHCEYRRALR